MPLEIVTVPCRTDNYAYLLRDPVSGAVGIVDPSEAPPVFAALEARAPYLLLLNPDTVTLDHAIDRLGNGEADHPHPAAIGIGAPETLRVGDVARQAHVFIAEGLDGGDMRCILRGDAAQFAGTDERLPGEDAPREQAEDDQDDGEFDQREGALHRTSIAHKEAHFIHHVSIAPIAQGVWYFGLPNLSQFSTRQLLM